MASIFCPQDAEAAQFKKDVENKEAKALYFINKYDGIFDLPAFDSLINSLGDQLGGLALSALGNAMGDATKFMSSVMSVVALAMTAGDSAKVAMFAFMASNMKKEIMFRQHLYKKALFYLNAKKAILLKVRNGSSGVNITRTIQAKKKVEIALKNFKAVLRSLTEFSRFNTSFHKRGMSAVSEAIEILTGGKKEKYKSLINTPVYENLKTSVDGIVRNIALEALSKLIDLKNIIWYSYQILACVIGDVSIFSSKIKSGLKEFEQGGLLNKAGNEIQNYSVTGQKVTGVSNSYNKGISQTAAESQDFDEIESSKSYLKTLNSVLKARGLYLVTPGISTYVNDLADYFATSTSINEMATQLLSEYKPLVKKTETINDEMGVAIEAATRASNDSNSSENASILLKNMKWALDLTWLGWMDTVSAVGEVQEGVSRQMEIAQGISGWMSKYRTADIENLEHNKGIRIILYAIGFFGAAKVKESGDIGLDVMSILSFIGTLLGSSFLSGKALDTAIIATNEGILQLNRCIGRGNEMISELSKINLNDNPLFSFLSNLSNAPAPFNAVGNMLSAGNLSQFSSILTTMIAAGGAVESLLALSEGCPGAGDGDAAAKNTEEIQKAIDSEEESE